jgi:hypothetical protein
MSGFSQVLLCASALTLYSLPEPPEAVLTVPQVDRTSNDVRYDTIVGGLGEYTLLRSDADEITGFHFENPGANRIVPVRSRGIGLGPRRSYFFRFRDRARQDIHLAVTDSPTDFLSDFMESYLYFFPRKVIPAIQWPREDEHKAFKVILPTGEVLEFAIESSEIVSGPLRETRPLDLNPNRSSRQFAGLEYFGKGVYLRVDRRAGDPRQGTTATVHSGSRKCQIPSRELFNQNPEGAFTFLFPADEEFEAFLLKRCGSAFGFRKNALD